MLCFCTWLSVEAQDIIIFTNGDEVEAKVVEVSDTEIKYKTWSNLNGPTWVKKTTEIFMIHYENGTKQTFSTAQKLQQQTIPQPTQSSYNYNNYSAQQVPASHGPTRAINNTVCVGAKIRGGYNRMVFVPGPQLLDYHGSKWSLSYAAYLDYYPNQTKKNGSPFTGFGLEVMYANRGGTITKNFDPVPFTFNLQYVEMRPSLAFRDNVAYVHLGADICFVSKAKAKWTSEQSLMEIDMKEYDIANTPLFGVWTDFGFNIGKHFTIEFNADAILTALNEGSSGVVQPDMFASGNTYSLMYSISIAIGWLFTPMKITVLN